MTETQGVIYEYAVRADGAALCAVYGDSPCLALPEMLDGLPLRVLLPYCFAENPRPQAGEMHRTGSCPAGSETHRICGSFLKEIILPESLREIGTCAFYNCRALERLSAGRQIEAVGSDVFLNTFRLQELELRYPHTAPGSLFRIVNNITTDVRAVFRPTVGDETAFWFPEYWEDIEETPAHILLHNYAGQGYHYRQCFRDDVLNAEEYDAVFPRAYADNAASTMVQLCLDRLCGVPAPTQEWKSRYEAFLREHAALLLRNLRKAEDAAALEKLLQLGILDRAQLQAGAEEAAGSGNALFAARLTDAAHHLQAPARKGKARYDFDF